MPIKTFFAIAMKCKIWIDFFKSNFFGCLKNWPSLFYLLQIYLKQKVKFGRHGDHLYWNKTRQVSSMIHSARPIVTSVATSVFCCCVFLDLKSGDGRTDGRTGNMCENNDPNSVTLGWPSGSIRLRKLMQQIFLKL